MEVLNRRGYANVYTRSIQLPSFSKVFKHISPPTTQMRITYGRCQREIKWLKNKLRSQAYKLQGEYGDYGSTEGEWRLLSTMRGRTKLTSRAGVHRSKHLQARR